MKLPAQLFLVSLTLLILPWAAFEFIVELDRNLRVSQLAVSQSQTDAIAESLQGGDRFVSRVRPESKTLLAAKLNSPVLLDGYAHDWATFELESRRFIYLQNKVSVEPEDLAAASEVSIHAATRRGRLYLFLRVTDDRFLFHQPNRREMSSGDSIIMRVLSDDGSIRRHTFRWEAPGRTLGRYHGEPFEGERPILTDNRYIATLVETAAGYDVEVRMPLPVENRFGLSVVDVDQRGGVARWTGMFDPNELDDTGQLKVLDESITAQLDIYTRPGNRVRVFDAQGWLKADADRRAPDASVREFEPENANFFDAIVYRFISWSLAKNVTAKRLSEIESGKLSAVEFDVFESLADNGPAYFKDKYGRVFLTSLQRVVDRDDVQGYVLTQQPRAALAAFTESAVLRLVKIFGIAVLLVAAVLLSYATFLSWRIRRLRNVVESVVATDGKITGVVKRAAAPDEIGDLSRSFNGIITRLSNYTGYLQSLGSRLSHELRTPLSVVTTSLESIDKNTLDNRSVISVERAQLGAARLQQLIRNLSEASSLEHTIQMSEKEPVRLVDWVEVARDVYASTHTNRHFVADIRCEPEITVFASLELLHQMFDKLVSNAVDFSSEGSTIVLGVQQQPDGIALSVENSGSQLPDNMGSALFEPMVTQRDHRDDQPHMGLGLYVVRLIADYHGASAKAVNDEPRQLVRFIVKFPR